MLVILLRDPQSLKRLSAESQSLLIYLRPFQSTMSIVFQTKYKSLLYLTEPYQKIRLPSEEQVKMAVEKFGLKRIIVTLVADKEI